MTPLAGRICLPMDGGYYNNSQNLSKFNAETTGDTHAMEHGGRHRKYIASVDTNSSMLSCVPKPKRCVSDGESEHSNGL